MAGAEKVIPPRRLRLLFLLPYLDFVQRTDRKYIRWQLPIERKLAIHLNWYDRRGSFWHTVLKTRFITDFNPVFPVIERFIVHLVRGKKKMKTNLLTDIYFKLETTVKLWLVTWKMYSIVQIKASRITCWERWWPQSVAPISSSSPHPWHNPCTCMARWAKKRKSARFPQLALVYRRFDLPWNCCHRRSVRAIQRYRSNQGHKVTFTFNLARFAYFR